MKKLLILLVLGATMLTPAHAQMTFDDVTIPGTLTISNQSLTLNGAGIREKYFLDLYVGGLYLKSKSSNADQIIKANEPMAIKLHIISSLIDSEKMIDAVDEGMEKSTGGKQDQFKSEISAFKNAFKEEIEIGDIYDIGYTPKGGTVIIKNGKSVATIPGFEFKKALFGIWLCDDPADEDLKEGMLKG